MDQAKLKSTIAQAVPSGAQTLIVLGTELLRVGTTVVPSTGDSTIQVTESGYYLVCVEALVAGTGRHKVLLLGNGFISAGTELMDFAGTAAGVNHGMVLLIRATANAILNLYALHDAGANRDYTCSISVSKLAAA